MHQSRRGWHVKEAGDFNGDGKADILWQNDDGTPAVWLMDSVNVLAMGPALSDPVRAGTSFDGTRNGPKYA